MASGSRGAHWAAAIQLKTGRDSRGPLQNQVEALSNEPRRGVGEGRRPAVEFRRRAIEPEDIAFVLHDSPDDTRIRSAAQAVTVLADAVGQRQVYLRRPLGLIDRERPHRQRCALGKLEDELEVVAAEVHQEELAVDLRDPGALEGFGGGHLISFRWAASRPRRAMASVLGRSLLARNAFDPRNHVPPAFAHSLEGKIVLR